MAKILVVDDSKTMREMVVFTLKQSGHDTTEACDGKEALGCAQGGQFDVVISDVNMSIMDGLTLIKELRKLPAYKYTPLLMLTTESSAEKKAEGKASGATGWLVKPFSPDKLIATINKVL